MGVGARDLVPAYPERDQLDHEAEDTAPERVPSAAVYSKPWVLSEAQNPPTTLSSYLSLAKAERREEKDLGAHAWSGAHCRHLAVQARTSQIPLGSILLNPALEREVTSREGILKYISCRDDLEQGRDTTR